MVELRLRYHHTIFKQVEGGESIKGQDSLLGDSGT
jgi:hypothetical protein